MNTEFFIAKRIVSSKDNRKSVSHSIVRIAQGGIAISLAVMLLSVAIVTGFKKEVAEKVVGFGAHIQITNHDANASYETVPIAKKQDFLPLLMANPNITHVNSYGIKAGIIKTEHDIQGVVLKGVDTDFDWSFFKKHLVAGEVFAIDSVKRTKNILVSEYMAKLLNLKLGEKLILYFVYTKKEKGVTPPPRVRDFIITGIYNTGLEIYDQTLVVGDIKHVQRLNNWNKNQVTGYEVQVADVDDLDKITEDVWDTVGYEFAKDGSRLYVTNIRQIKPEIFTWLDMTDTNVEVIIGLTLIVAVFNMISTLLILILERTQMIGILKSLGMTNGSIRKVFLYHASFLTARGMFFGNVLGLGLAFLQLTFHIIPLDPTSYYVDMVPININIWHVVFLNAITLLVITLMLIIPAFVIKKISPIKAIRFE